MIIGNAQQQATKLASYLAQFQYEQSRGQGNSALMSMFESAFAEMNSNYNVGSGNGASGTSPDLSAAGQSMLTGLADFTATVTQTPVSSNPYLPGETDTFSFQVSQSSDIEGDQDDPFDIAVKQHQASHLSASFHKALPGASPLQLTDSIDSQNYGYYQIDDSASCDAKVAFQQGKLIKATLDHSASQSTHEREYVQGQRVQDTTEPPVAESWSKDLLKELLTRQQSTNPSDSLQVSPTLLQVNSVVDLQVDPSEVQLAGGQI
jgi:hypothetical protein